MQVILKVRLHPVEQFLFNIKLGLSLFLSAVLNALKSLFNKNQVMHNKLGIYHLNVAHSVNRPARVINRIVSKGPGNVTQRVHP